MESLSPRRSLLIALALAAVIAVTRHHHVGDITHLPDASWAVFFVAGFYFGTGRHFAALLAVAAITDFAAITWGGVSDFCVSPAYGFLVPAYGALFLAGRWYASRHQAAWRSIVRFLAAAFVGTLACEAISGGSFYFFSGRFTNPGLAGFAERFVAYFPGSAESMALWLGVASMVHVALRVVSTRAARVH